MVSTPPNPVALVTGASSGIGLEMAKQLAAGKVDLVVVARSEEKLKELSATLEKEHGVKVTVIAADLADPAAPQRIVSELERQGLEIQILVNNAGHGAFGQFLEHPLESDLSMLQVNVVALTALTKLLLPKMVERKYGRVLNVASTAAFQPGPMMAVYYATKAYVLSLSEALRNELADSGVTCTALCPGPVASGFQSRANMEDSKLLKNLAVMDSASVARMGLDGMFKGTAIVIPGAMNKMLVQSIRFAPRSMVTWMVRRMQDRAQA